MLRCRKGQGLVGAGVGAAVQEGVGPDKCDPERADAEISAIGRPGTSRAGPNGADRKGWVWNGGPDENRGLEGAGKKGRA